MQIDRMAGHLIRRLHQHSAHVFQARMKAAGLDLTPVQFSAMGAVRDCPGIDQAGVAGRIGYDRATIGGVVERLVQKGHLRREVSATDRRARAVYLTEGGAALLERVEPMVDAFQAEILPGLTWQERRDFEALALKVLHHLAGPGDGAEALPEPAADRAD